MDPQDSCTPIRLHHTSSYINPATTVLPAILQHVDARGGRQRCRSRPECEQGGHLKICSRSTTTWPARLLPVSTACLAAWDMNPSDGSFACSHGTARSVRKAAAMCGCACSVRCARPCHWVKPSVQQESRQKSLISGKHLHKITTLAAGMLCGALAQQRSQFAPAMRLLQTGRCLAASVQAFLQYNAHAPAGHGQAAPTKPSYAKCPCFLEAGADSMSAAQAQQ